MRLIDRLLDSSDETTDDTSRRALVTGSVAAGALLTSFIIRRMRRRRSRPVHDLAPAMNVPVRDMEIMEGRYRFYARDGRGVPVVLLHSINAAGSSFEMKPIFDALCASTPRPIYALDWFGFGLSDRPPVEYTPSLYQRQLRRFLSEHIHQPADIVAYSLGCEFAAMMSLNHPFLFRRLVLIEPTGLDRASDERRIRKVLIDASQRTGVFEIAFQRLIRRDTLKRFYERQIFVRDADVPAELVDYAESTTRMPGAHHAPAAFIAGTLFSHDMARAAYESLTLPTLIIASESAPSSIQSFERLDEVAERNSSFIEIERVKTGLMPQYESESVVRRITDFLGDTAP